jgi:hypothetical protein
MQGRVAGELWSMGQRGKGVSGATVDERCSRVMEDRANWMEGEKETTERPTSQMSSSWGQRQIAAEEMSYL